MKVLRLSLWSSFLFAGLALAHQPDTLYSLHLGSRAQYVAPATFTFSVGIETREVAIDGFYLKTQLVTVGEYQQYLSQNPDAGTPEYWFHQKEDPNQPVVGLDLRAIVPFLKWMSASDGKFVYRLPTEAEWQRARAFKFIETNPFAVGEFLLDRYSETFSDWGVDPGIIHNPFGPIEGMNVVGIRLLPGNLIERGPLAPDHVSLGVGFRYAFSLSGPGPVGARMMKEAALQGTLPELSAPAAKPDSEPKTPIPVAQPPIPPAGSPFLVLFGELARLQGEMSQARKEYYSSNPTFQMFQQTRDNPLVVAVHQAAAELRQTNMDKETYEKTATAILPQVKSLIPPAVFEVYARLIHESVQAHPPRDATDEKFFNLVTPFIKQKEVLASQRFRNPFPEGSLENRVAFYLVGYELDRFAQLWQASIGREPVELRDKEKQIKALLARLSNEYPEETKAVAEQLISALPGNPRTP